MAMGALVGVLGGVAKKVVGGIADKFFPDAEDQHKRDELTQALDLALLQAQSEIMNAAAGVVTAEVQGKSPLQRNWRPLLMLTFGAMVVARVMGWADGISEQEATHLWSLLKLGIGGYIIGRSGEKVLPGVAERLAGAVKRGGGEREP